MRRHRTLSLGILFFAALAVAATAGAYPYCGATQACGVPPREFCDTLCYECTGFDAGTESDGAPAGSCENPTLVCVRKICCPCIESDGNVNYNPCDPPPTCPQPATGISDQKLEAQDQAMEPFPFHLLWR